MSKVREQEVHGGFNPYCRCKVKVENGSIPRMGGVSQASPELWECLVQAKGVRSSFKTKAQCLDTQMIQIKGKEGR